MGRRRNTSTPDNIFDCFGIVFELPWRIVIKGWATFCLLRNTAVFLSKIGFWIALFRVNDCGVLVCFGSGPSVPLRPIKVIHATKMGNTYSKGDRGACQIKSKAKAFFLILQSIVGLFVFPLVFSLRSQLFDNPGCNYLLSRTHIQWLTQIMKQEIAKCQLRTTCGEQIHRFLHMRAAPGQTKPDSQFILKGNLDFCLAKR